MKKLLVLIACLAAFAAFNANAQVCGNYLFTHISGFAYIDLGYGPNPNPCLISPCNNTNVYTAHFWTWDANSNASWSRNTTNDTSWVLGWGAPDGVYLSGDWSNYNNGVSVIGCQSPDYDPMIVAASWQEAGATATRNAYFFVVSTDRYLLGSRYEFDQTGIVMNGEPYPYVNGMANPTLNGLNYDLDITWTPCTTNYNQTVTDNIIGYQFVYQIVADVASAPTTGAIAGWTPVLGVNGLSTSYIAGRATASATVTVPDTAGQVMYIAMRPIFGNNVDTIAGTPDNLPRLPMVGGNGLSYAGLQLGFGGTSAAKVTSFTATVELDGTVSLDWRTGSESDFSGFNVYRSVDTVNFDKINSSLINAKGQAGSGATYSLTDRIDSKGKRTERGERTAKTQGKVTTASYKLELVNEDGTTSFISATTVDMAQTARR